MADKILEFVHTSTGKQIAAALGLPVPPLLKRAKAGYAEKSLANSVNKLSIQLKKQHDRIVGH